MNKTLVSLAIAGVMGIATQSAQAALLTDATLTIDTGSFFSVETAPSFFVDTDISGFNGINLGTIQPASGSHSGAPDGTEAPDIDNPWLYFGSTGMHQSTSAINVLSDDGSGSVTLDFSGWSVTWNGIADIALGSGGIATMSCGNTCEVGDTYVLDYAASNPEPSFGEESYKLHLEGTVVPVPAAVWLFGSGLLGLVGVARRKSKA